MVQKSVVAGKRRMVYDALQSHDSAEALALEEKREDSGDWLVGDGSVDSHGHVADKRRTGGWRAAPLIFGTELCERLATLGLQRNLVLYFTTEMHFSNPESAKMVSNFVGAVYLTPFLGGFAADAYLGRFWAITIFATIQVLGMICLALSATVPWLRPPPCSPNSLRSSCEPSHGVQVAVLYLGLFLFAVGNGGIKPNVSTLGADQFDEGDPNERKHMSHFFNWFYFIISIGSLLSVTLFVYIQDNVGFGWGFGLPAAVMMVAVVVFLAGARIYRFKAPGGSALTTIAQVVVAAARNRKVCVTTGERFLYEGPTHGSRPVEKLSHTDQLLFLDRAAIPAKDSNLLATSAWHLCSVTQVEEVKMILKVLPIWVSTLLVWTALSQMETFTVEVGATMDRHVTAKFLFPSASLAVFELVNIIFILPLYDRFLVPLLRRFTGHPQGITTLQRIGTGMIFATLAMVAAAAVETRRVQVARENGLLDRPDLTIPMSVFWLVPQNFLRGSTEIFTQIGQLEFFYNEAPERMRSLGSAIYLSTIACGFFLSSALVTAVNKFTSSPGWLTDNLNRSRLDLFYLLLAGLTLCNFFLFLVCSSWYKYKQVNTSRSYTRIIDDHDEA